MFLFSCLGNDEIAVRLFTSQEPFAHQLVTVLQPFANRCGTILEPFGLFDAAIDMVSLPFRNTASDLISGMFVRLQKKGSNPAPGMLSGLPSN